VLLVERFVLAILKWILLLLLLVLLVRALCKWAGAPATTHDDKDDGPEPNPLLEAGSKLPAKMAGEFPPELFGKPIEDVDEFYHNKYVSRSTPAL